MKQLLTILPLLLSVMGTAQPFIYVVNSIGKSVELFIPNEANSSVLLENLDTPQDIEYDEGNHTLYVSDPGQFKILGINSSGVFDVFSNTEALDLQLYDNNSKLLWTTSDDLVVRYDLVTNDLDTLYEGESFLTLYALATAPDGTIFFSDWWNDRILKTDLESGTVETLFADIGDIWSIKVDSVNNQIYFTNFSERMIQRAGFDGGNLDTVVFNAGQVRGLDINFAENKLYWATDLFGSRPYKIQRSDLDGSNIETLFEFSPFDDVNIFSLKLSNNFITKTGNLQQEQKAIVYPNPCSDFLVIDGNAHVKEDIATLLRVINSEGKVCQEKAIPSFPYTLDMADLPVNSYFVELLKDGLIVETIQVSKVK